MPHPTIHSFIGGEVLGKGGYGCVFKPQMECDNAHSLNKNKGISKFMKTRHAQNEYKDIIKYSKFIKRIPNYKNYFIIDNIHLCVPKQIPIEEFNNLNKCNNIFSSSKVNSQNKLHNFTLANELLKDNEFSIINMPYGGISLFQFITNNKHFGYPEILWINTKLKDLIDNAIKPLNKMGIYHNDIKSDNLLVDNSYIRIIDWGLSYHFKGHYIPKQLSRSLILFNLPFSNIIFSIKNIPKLYQKINRELKNTTLQIENVKTVLREFIQECGEGHIHYFIHIIIPLFFKNIKHDKHLCEDMFFNIVAQYLQPIFFLDETRFNNFITKDYFKIADIYGLFTTYFDLLELDNTSLKTKYIIRDLFINYLWKNPLNIDLKIIYKYMKLIETSYKKKTVKERGGSKMVKHSKTNKIVKNRGGNPFNALKKLFTGVINTTTKSVKTVGTAMGVANSSLKLVGSTTNAAANIVDSTGNAAANIVGSTGNAAANIVDSTGKATAQIFNATNETATDTLKNTTKNLNTLFTSSTDLTTEAIGNLTKELDNIHVISKHSIELFKTVASMVTKIINNPRLTEVINKLTANLTDKIGDIATNTTKIPNSIILLSVLPFKTLIHKLENVIEHRKKINDLNNENQLKDIEHKNKIEELKRIIELKKWFQ